MRWLCLLLVALGCDGADSDAGLDRPIRVPGAQLVRGRLTPGSGPAITQVDVRSAALRPGQGQYRLAGRAEGSARAIHLGVEGDGAFWVVPTTTPDPTDPEELSWSARIDVRPDLKPGPLRLVLRAVDAQGRAGPLERVDFEVAPSAPEGALVVTLRWDVPADLDLYVVDPSGRRLGLDDLNTYTPPPPGAPPDPPDAWRAGGQHSGDVGAGCATQGRLAEHAVWGAEPPSGTYRVLVDLAADCGQARAAWTVQVRRDGALLTESAGVLYPADARRAATTGAAPFVAARFDVP
jgi:hypothetical protein